MIASPLTARVGPVRLVALLLAFLSLAGCGVNEIPTLAERVDASWSEVLNQYQRRADLVPNLVETVRGLAEQEREVLIAVTEARARVAQTPIPPDITTNPEAFQRFQENQQVLSSALSRLIATVEAYPDLRSSEGFVTLQAQLEGTENRIAVARRDYIEAVRQYNTALRTIPGRWWAAFLYPEAEPRQQFTIAEGVEAPPPVRF